MSSENICDVTDESELAEAVGGGRPRMHRSGKRGRRSSARRTSARPGTRARIEEDKRGNEEAKPAEEVKPNEAVVEAHIDESDADDV